MNLILTGSWFDYVWKYYYPQIVDSTIEEELVLFN